MPSWFLRLLEIFKDSNGHWNWPWIGAAILAVGAAIAAVAQGIWAVVTFIAERKKTAEKKGGDTKATQTGQVAASGRDTTFQGPVTFAPSPELVAQIQKPLADELAARGTQKENLTKMLLERNPAATGPGAQQAVGEAVGSIAKGAAEGDSRLQQALDLLKANKMAEAVQLLNAFAEDKRVRIEKDRKEAAIAYRNLGAIAGLADPKRALEAYEKALALDPDDIESLFWTGWIQISYGDLGKAQTRLERVLMLAKTDDQAYYKYWAFIGLGDIKQQRGDLSRALKSYSDGLAIAERFAQSGPSNAGWQRDLSVSYEKIGDVQQAQGDLAGALKSYQDSLAIRDRLAKSDPGNAGWQRDLSAANERLGDIFIAQGNLPAALEQYRASLDRMVPVRDRDPSNADLQRFTSVTNERLGDIFIAQGNLPAALEQYRASLDRMVPIRDRDPSNADLQRFTSAHQDRRRACGAGRPCRGAEILFRQPRHFRPPREIRPRQRGPAI
jgi:tetratricopeptide (TPR) repeat protein